MFASISGIVAAGRTSIHCLPPGKRWRMAFAGCLLAAASGFAPGTAFAQANVSVDSIRVLKTTPDAVEIEVAGANDGSMEQLCLRVMAKSKDGEVRSQWFDTAFVPNDTKQFQLRSRVVRPEGLARPQTDYLWAILYPCGTEIITLTRKFNWSHAWPEKKAENAGGHDADPGGARPRQELFEHLKEEDFGALDSLLQKWNSPRERDENGMWKLDSFRSVFLNFSDGERDWKKDLERIQKWRAYNPRSAGASIAEARYWEAYAWRIRGDEANTQTDPVALRVFGERMRRAEQVLKEARDYAAGNPLWYEAYLDIAVSAKRDDKFMEALYNEAIRKHPYFQALYSDMTRYAAPWSGRGADWKKVDEVIRQATTNTASTDGAGNYAVLYAQIITLQKLEFDPFQDSLLSWVKMKDAFDDLVQRYPSVENLNEYAAYACRAGDKSAFLSIRPRIIGHIVPDKWPGNYSYDLCDHRFMQSA